MHNSVWFLGQKKYQEQRRYLGVATVPRPLLKLRHTWEKPCGCSECSEMFARKTGLRMFWNLYMRPSESYANSHRGEPCCCAECHKTYTWFRSLNQHARIHTGEKPFKCSHCGHSFSRENNLKTRVRINTGEKSYKCPHCSDSFSKKSYLMTHVSKYTG